jgi:hypothetical protein
MVDASRDRSVECLMPTQAQMQAYLDSLSPTDHAAAKACYKAKGTPASVDNAVQMLQACLVSLGLEPDSYPDISSGLPATPWWKIGLAVLGAAVLGGGAVFLWRQRQA